MTRLLSVFAMFGLILGIAGAVSALDVAPGTTVVGSRAAVGEAVSIDGEMVGDLVVLAGETEVRGVVGGDVVTWGGRLRLAPGARIRGSVMVVAGELLRADEARIEGRVLVWGDVAVLAKSLVSTSEPVSGGLLARWQWGLRLASMGLWLLASCLVVAVGSARLEEATGAVRQRPLPVFLAGVVTFFGLLLTAWALLGLPGRMATVLLASLGAAALLAKIFGMVVVFLMVGRAVVRLTGFGRMSANAAAAVTIGVLLLGTLRYLPLVGVPLWLAASLTALGASASALLGPRPDPIPAS